MVSPASFTIPRCVAGLVASTAWTLLELESLNALRREPSRDNRALRLAKDLTGAEMAASAITRNNLILVRRQSIAMV